MHSRFSILSAPLVACVIAVAPVSSAQAQDAISLDLPSQPLVDSLKELASRSNLNVFFEPGLVAGIQAPALQGTVSAREALQRLLEGSGLTYRTIDERTLAVVAQVSDPRSSSSKADPAASGVSSETAGISDRNIVRGGLRLAQADRRETASDNTAAKSVAAVAENPARIEEIVVSAQRRTERLIDVPLSMSVLGVDEVERRGLVSREDYLRTIPNVSVRDDGVGLAEIIIRGAYGDSFRTGPTVGLYFGDVPLSGYAIGGSADIKLIDIQRVEVLRGPQGTLYGSNALSGAIRYIAAEPDLQDFSGSLRVGYSNTARHGGSNNAVDGVINLPIVADKFSVRAVAFRHFNEGYIRNVAGDDAALQAAAAASGATHLAINKDHVGATEYVGGRISALWQPTEALGINLTYVNQRDSQDDRLFELRQAGPYQRSDYQLGQIIGGSDDAQRIDLDILNVTAHYEFDWGTLYSSTAWMEQDFVRKWDIGSLTSIFGTPLKPISQISTTEADVFAQEVRFTSNFDGPIQLVTGLYYEDSGQPTQQPTYFAGDPVSNTFAAVKLWQIDLERDVEQKAVYGQLSYDPTQQLKLTLGGRYFDYESRFSTRTFDTVILAPSNSSIEAQESGETFKAGIEYKPSDAALVYASWSQGFRLGRPLATEFIRAVCDLDQDGVIDGTNISSNLNRVDSDRLDSYELGAKFSLMGGRAMLSTAIYRNDWSDIPVVYQPPGCSTTLTINAGSAMARGFEGEASFRLFDALKLSLGIGYVNSELTATTTQGRDGDKLNYTPELNGHLGVEYGFSIAQRSSFIRGDYSYFGSYYTQTGHRGIRADAYGVLSIRGGIAVTENADVLVHVDNALNADDYTTVVGPSGFPPGYSVRLRPRTIGVGLTYRF